MKPEKIFENEDYIGFSKPSGLLSIPDRFNPEIPSLVGIARQSFPNIYVVHRLDRDTSGVICFAKKEQAHRYLSGLFAKHELTKEYLAMVSGTPLQPKGSLSMPIQADPVRKGKMQVGARGKATRTDYEVLKSWRHFSLLKVALFTGRTHQIRVHLSYFGHAVVCDDFYGDGQPFLLSSIKKKYKLSGAEEAERPLLNQLALHACKLAFTAENGAPIVMEAPLPKGMTAMIKQLDKWDK